MFDGAHIIIYSKDAEADRAFLRDVLGLPHVDVGEGWLIFALPPAEVAVHPAEAGDSHELYLMCADVEKVVALLSARGVSCDPIANRGWGLLTSFTLPGGSKLSFYQPRHARPSWRKATTKRAHPVARGKRAAKPSRRPARAAKPRAGQRAGKPAGKRR
jgi:catechol 2,3-dioxygenase-like lactoylglutathione lyase family enzyme